MCLLSHLNTWTLKTFENMWRSQELFETSLDEFPPENVRAELKGSPQIESKRYSRKQTNFINDFFFF